MSSRLIDLFHDKNCVERIKKKLPYLFYLAQLEASRAGRTGMEVGSLREKILIALLIYRFGEENVDTDLPITEPEVDVKLYGQPISIKTITGKGGVKANWAVDASSAQEFTHNYVPKADLLLAEINWNAKGFLYLIPLEVQIAVFEELRPDRYFKLPKLGTNPRGVEFTKEALQRLEHEEGVEMIEITWQRDQPATAKYEVYKRWVDYWGDE